eukprot:gene8105-10977_t
MTYGITSGYSEVVKVITMGGYDESKIVDTQVNCPHQRSGLVQLVALYPNLPLNSGSDILINGNLSVLLRQTDLPHTGYLNRITVAPFSKLVFNDESINLHVREIYVSPNAELWIGSETCRLSSHINITFHGTKSDSSTVDQVTGITSKGLIVDGQVDIHGKQYHPTWTRLSVIGTVGSSWITLQDRVNWEVGQQILLTTTVFFDCTEVWESKCDYEHQNEIRRIIGFDMNIATSTYRIQLDSPLNYDHYAGNEYQGEVALLTRRIVLQGTKSNDEFGGHTKIKGLTSQGRFSGVQADFMGQKNILGRYPFHFHRLEESIGSNNSYFQDCSVTNSFFRCYTIHGTNNTKSLRNVAYNITGMCFYLEDGVEENNDFYFNLAAHISPINDAADGGWGQGGARFTASSDLLIPADTSASGYYISNAMNTFVGNVASGGWSGFAFPNVVEALGDYKGTVENYNYLPMNRPLKRFYGNTAHSSGFYWQAHGSCFYVGAWLGYENNVLTYYSGRHARDTRDGITGESLYILFEDTKAFLCNAGIAHWGNDFRIESAEMHDVELGAFMFGSSGMSNTIINLKSGNSKVIMFPWMSKMGFQFYDTWTRIILDRVTFRNIKSSNSDCAIRYMDHSDHYTPQGINSVGGLKFQNVDSKAIVCIDHCSECPTTQSTMSSRIYTIWDWDGSLSGKGVPTIMGSNIDWWNIDNSCSKNSSTHLWSCPWVFDKWNIGNKNHIVKDTTTGLDMIISNRTVAFLSPYVPGIMDGCDYDKFSTCTDQYASYTVGRMTIWGANQATQSVNLGPWPGVSGMSNIGWYWRVKAPEYGIDGAPSTFSFETYQMAEGSFVIIAIAYPPTTKFTVNIGVSPSWGWGVSFPTVPMASSLQQVLSQDENPTACDSFDNREWWQMCSDTDIGLSWYFDQSYLYLRMVPFWCYNVNQHHNCNPENQLDAYGKKVWNINTGFIVSVNSSCNGCAVNSVYKNVTYYEVADVVPPLPLNDYFQDVGSLPTKVPTTAPSMSAPSYNPSKSPSSAPSSRKTNSPTLKPSTIVPTSKPSGASTTSPSTKPSNTPTPKPTGTPTTRPSTKPSNSPTPKPTATPISKPSAKPSNGPSSKPTAIPKSKPTIKPR